MVAVTPDQAKSFWCPETRYIKAVDKMEGSEGAQPNVNIPEHQAAANRIESLDGTGFGIPLACMCIADRCMAWRFFNDTHGYCGKFGRPDRM